MGRRASHSLNQVLLVAEGSASGELLGEQHPERGSRAGMNSGLAGQGRGRRGVGGKNISIQKGKGSWNFPKNICYRAGGSNGKGTGPDWHRSTHCAALGGDRNSSTGSTHCLRCPASPLLPLCDEDTASSAGVHSKPQGPGFKLWEHIPCWGL